MWIWVCSTLDQRTGRDCAHSTGIGSSFANGWRSDPLKLSKTSCFLQFWIFHPCLTNCGVVHMDADDAERMRLAEEHHLHMYMVSGINATREDWFLGLGHDVLMFPDLFFDKDGCLGTCEAASREDTGRIGCGVLEASLLAGKHQIASRPRSRPPSSPPVSRSLHLTAIRIHTILWWRLGWRLRLGWQRVTREPRPLWETGFFLEIPNGGRAASSNS